MLPAVAALVVGVGVWLTVPTVLEPDPAETLIVATVAPVQGLDPRAVTAVSDFRVIFNIYEGLLRFQEGSLRVEPALADSFSRNDSVSYTFYLKEEVRFHDGARFDAHVVRAHFHSRLPDPHGSSEPTGLFAVLDSVEVIDDHEVEFHLRRPYAPFLTNLAYTTGLIVSPAQLDVAEDEFVPRGTGPFRYLERTPEGDTVILARHERYWGPRPLIRRVMFVPIVEGDERAAALVEGRVDMVTELSPEHREYVESRADFRISPAPGPHLWFVILNGCEEPFEEPLVRRAVNLAVNKHGLAGELLGRTATVARGPLPEGFTWALNYDLEPYPYLPDSARALLEAAAVGDDVLNFYVPETGSGMLSPVRMAQQIQSDLAEVGLFVRIIRKEWGEYLETVNDGLGNSDIHLAEMAWMVDDPHTLFNATLRSDGPFNSGCYENPEVDSLIESASSTVSMSARVQDYRQIQKLVREDAPWLFVLSWKQALTVSREVWGVRLQPSFFLDLSRIDKTSLERP